MEMNNSMIINELIGHLELLLLVVVGLTLTASFCGMLYLCIQNLRFIHSYQEDLKKRVDGLRIHRMLGTKHATWKWRSN
jgi:hypothetical protein